MIRHYGESLQTLEKQGSLILGSVKKDPAPEGCSFHFCCPVYNAVTIIQRERLQIYRGSAYNYIEGALQLYRGCGNNYTEGAVTIIERERLQLYRGRRYNYTEGAVTII